MDELIVESTKYVVKCLVNEDYEAIEIFTQGIRATKDDIRQMIQDYGKTLIFPPKEAFEEDLNIIAVENSDMPKYSVYFHLWTKEEGMSDLSLELTVIFEDNECKVELDDIHVL